MKSSVQPPACNASTAFVRAFIIGCVLLGSGCSPDDVARERAVYTRVLALLEESGSNMQHTALALTGIYDREQNQQQVSEALVTWAVRHPQDFAILASHLAMDDFAEGFAASAAAAGKAFLLIERLDGAGAAVQPLLQAIQILEHRDRRFKVPAFRLAPDSPLQRIARLSAIHAGRAWTGGAMLLLESQCQLGFATAGHTFANASGALRAPLESFELEFSGNRYRVAEVVAVQPSVAPEHDWALLVVNKEYCGSNSVSETIELSIAADIPEAGLEVEFYCYHQGPADVGASLYQENCQVYPSDAGILDHYADKPAGLLGVHSCRSEKGSSGCPILLKTAAGFQFVGTQIERDSLTRAGIARLFSAEFRLALIELSARFRENDQAYALQNGRRTAQ